MAFSYLSISRPLLQHRALLCRQRQALSPSRRHPNYCASLTSSRTQPTPLSTASKTPSNTFPTNSERKRIIFFGSPQVAADTLQYLWDHSTSGHYEIVGVITKPPTRNRKKVLQYSPVYQVAEQLGIARKLTPHGPLRITLHEDSSDTKGESGMKVIKDLRPHLFITAAYGFKLPNELLDIPKGGTLNIHPSLLPRYRGAAPVQRALEAGEKVTGVCIVRTVEKMDAGPILYEEEYELGGDEQSEEVLQLMFRKGAEALVAKVLPSVLWDGKKRDGSVIERIKEIEQTETGREVCIAKKLTVEERYITFTENAVQIHNKVRGRSMWPGTWGTFILKGKNDGDEIEEIMLKIVRTQVEAGDKAAALGVHEVRYEDGALHVVCDDGSILRVLEVQKKGGNVMNATAFWNGLRGRTLERKKFPY